MIDNTRSSAVLTVVSHGLLELRALANKPDKGEQRYALADALHNLPAFVAGRLRVPGRPAVKTGFGVAGSRELHDEFLLGESIQRLRQYQSAFADCMFDYAAMTTDLLAAIEAERGTSVRIAVDVGPSGDATPGGDVAAG